MINLSIRNEEELVLHDISSYKGVIPRKGETFVVHYASTWHKYKITEVVVSYNTVSGITIVRLLTKLIDEDSFYGT